MIKSKRQYISINIISCVCDLLICNGCVHNQGLDYWCSKMVDTSFKKKGWNEFVKGHWKLKFIQEVDLKNQKSIISVKLGLKCDFQQSAKIGMPLLMDLDLSPPCHARSHWLLVLIPVSVQGTLIGSNRVKMSTNFS